MAVVRKTPKSFKKKEGESKPTHKTIKPKEDSGELRLPLYNNIDFDREVVGVVTDCDVATYNSNYIKLVVVLFYDAEGSAYEFFYNMNKQSANYLHRFASLFDEYKTTLNLYSIVGKTFIGKLNKNKGFLNLIGINSITEEAFSDIIKRLKESEEKSEMEEAYEFTDGDDSDI